MAARLISWLVLLGLLALSTRSPTLAANVEITESPRLGSTVIVFEGRVTKGDLFRVQQAFEVARRKGRPVHLSLHSPGGFVTEALLIAYFLREKGIGTILLPKAICASACAYIFFGGYDAKARTPLRIAYSGSRLAVHSAYLGDKEGKPLDSLPGVNPNLLYQQLQLQISGLLRPQ